MRPMTAAARVKSSSSAPPPDTVWKLLNPSTGTRSSTAAVESTAARHHTIVSRRGTGMPRSIARSALSAAARIAMPYFE